MTFFTSDLHLGHANIIRHCNRPFESVEKMDEEILQRWNAKVKPADTVYILGDLMFRNSKPPEEYLAQMPGKKHFIAGNHDKAWMKKTDLGHWFESVDMMLFTSDGQRKLTMCHYPMMSWPFSKHEGYTVQPTQLWVFHFYIRHRTVITCSFLRTMSASFLVLPKCYQYPTGRISLPL